MKEHNIKNPKRKGYYYGNGQIEFDEPLPAITSILKVISKDALMFWYAREAVKVALEDPSLSIKDIMSKTAVETRKSATRGTGVHNIFPKVIRGEEYKPYPEEYSGYILGIEKFISDMKPEILLADATVWSKKYKYAGSLDIVAKINGRIVLLDLKTGNTYPEHRLQLTAYKQALSEMGKEVDDTAVLLLKGDNVYQYILTNEPFDNFLKAKALWEWWKGEGNDV